MQVVVPEGHVWALLGILAVLAAGGVGCQTVDLPSMAVSPPGRFVPEEDERRLWNRAREVQDRIQRSGALYGDPALTEYLNTVARRMAPAFMAQADLSVEVRILKNPSLNAFTLPNGAIYIHSGLLARMENEAQLATLLGHEMAHVIHRHPVRHLRDLENKTGALATFGALVAPLAGGFGPLLYAVGALGMAAAVTGYAQEMETEADREGLAMMMTAGYDPQEATKLFLYLKEWVQEEKKPEPFFFSSHPRLAERIESYQALLGGLPPAPPRSPPPRVGEEEFRARTHGLLLDNAEMDLYAGRFLQARRSLHAVLARRPRDARAHYSLAESYRRQGGTEERVEAFRFYQAAIALDAGFADPHRGLGVLYHQEGKAAEAARALERYLELAPEAVDRAHVRSLLEEVRK